MTHQEVAQLKSNDVIQHKYNKKLYFVLAKQRRSFTLVDYSIWRKYESDHVKYMDAACNAQVVIKRGSIRERYNMAPIAIRILYEKA